MLTSIRSLTAAVALSGGALLATPALADDPPAAAPALTINGTAAVVSQYRFRGLAQSDNQPVFQGSITLAHKSGFYLATWGSSASAGSAPINIGGTEIDIYGGWTHPIGKSGVKVDMGVYGYLYPGASAGNYYEVYGSVADSFGPVTAKVGANFAPDQKVFRYNFTSPTQKNLYVYGELGAAIPKTGLSLHSHLGHTGGGFDWGQDYIDYTVGATYTWRNLAFDASFVGTKLSRSDINRGFGCAGNPACISSYYRMSKPVAVFSLTASF